MWCTGLIYLLSAWISTLFPWSDWYNSFVIHALASYVFSDWMWYMYIYFLWSVYLCCIVAKIYTLVLCSEFQLIHELCLYVLSASQRTELMRATLSTLHAFLSWIPLGYIFESPLVGVLFCLNNTAMEEYWNLLLCVAAWDPAKVFPSSSISKPYTEMLNWGMVLLLVLMSFTCNFQD